MKRDWDLVREILLAVEMLPDSESTLDEGCIENRLREEVSYHFRLMYEAGLIDAIDAGALSGDFYIPTSLTWEGHELLDKIRQQSSWNKVKGLVKEKGLDLSYDVLKVALGSAITKMF